MKSGYCLVGEQNNVSRTGIVYLTGAGPGDPGLLTLRAKQVLQLADLVLYDGLANPQVLDFTNGICERTARTRSDSQTIVPQEDINERLIQEARSGKCVVRLKGGDPFIFGRGSEEATALEEASIPYEVVPGITAATAAAEYAGFSYTHRSHTSAVAFVTGHEDPTKPESRLDYRVLAEFPGTLVFYMGLGRLENICKELIDNGKSKQTPAAIVCKASLPSQQVVQSNLQDLPSAAASAGLRPPSLIVVGECTQLRQAESWFEKRSLFGLAIAVTSAKHQSEDVFQEITVRSGQPVAMPLVDIQPMDEKTSSVIAEQLHRLGEFDWLVFTSSNGVTEFFRHLSAAGLDSRALGNLQIATVGPTTADCLRQFGIRSDVVPTIYNAEALAEALACKVDGKNVLWARAATAREVLSEKLLLAKAASVNSLIVYRNEDVASLPDSTIQKIQSSELDWIGITSPSAARRLAVLAKHQDIDFTKTSVQIASISPLTTTAAVEAGLVVAVTANQHNWTGILDAIGECKKVSMG